MSDLRVSTVLACRLTGFHRDRFNEQVAAGNFGCAPETVPGRARYFDLDDLVALRLFRDLLDDGIDAARAGQIACEVARVARLYPDAPAITLVENYFHDCGVAIPADRMPDPARWDAAAILGTDIRKATTFNIRKLRELIAHGAAKEQVEIGSENQ